MRRVRTTQIIEDFSRYSDFQYQNNNGGLLLNDNTLTNDAFLINEGWGSDLLKGMFITPITNMIKDPSNPDHVQDFVDLISFVVGFPFPQVGIALDVCNAAVYFYRGKFLLGAISVISAFPGVGDAIGRVLKGLYVVLGKILGGTFELVMRRVAKGKAINEAMENVPPKVQKKAISKIMAFNAKYGGLVVKTLTGITNIYVSIVGGLLNILSKMISPKNLIKVSKIFTKPMDTFLRFIMNFTNLTKLKVPIAKVRRLGKTFHKESSVKIAESFIKPKKIKLMIGKGTSYITETPFTGNGIDTFEAIAQGKLRQLINGGDDEIWGLINDSGFSEVLHRAFGRKPNKEQIAQYLMANGHDIYLTILRDVIGDKKTLDLLSTNYGKGVAQAVEKELKDNLSNLDSLPRFRSLAKAARNNSAFSNLGTPPKGVFSNAVGKSTYQVFNRIAASSTKGYTSEQIKRQFLNRLKSQTVRAVKLAAGAELESELALPCFDGYLYVDQVQVGDIPTLQIVDKKNGLKYVFYSVTSSSSDEILKVSAFYVNSDDNQPIITSTDIRCKAGSANKNAGDINVSPEDLNEYAVIETKTKYIKIGPVLIGLSFDEYENFRKKVGFSEDVMTPINKEIENRKKQEKDKEDKKREQNKKDGNERGTTDVLKGKNDDSVDDDKEPEQNKKDGNERGTTDVLKGKNDDPIDGDKKPKEQPSKREFDNNIKPVLNNQKLLYYIRNVANRGLEKSIEKIKQSSESPRDGAYYGKTSEGNDYAFFTNVQNINPNIVQKVHKDLEKKGNEAKFIEELSDEMIKKSNTVVFLDDKLKEKLIELIPNMDNVNRVDVEA